VSSVLHSESVIIKRLILIIIRKMCFILSSGLLVIIKEYIDFL